MNTEDRSDINLTSADPTQLENIISSVISKPTKGGRQTKSYDTKPQDVNQSKTSREERLSRLLKKLPDDASDMQLEENRTTRKMDLPKIAQHTTRRFPPAKKHKCPFCENKFTRTHNLNSHLLTHSQEKPFVCPTCAMKFRRLHDLKRHTKLHTGERPHICPKCNRKFARGDALARHTKGTGCCAGRRSSIGSFGGDDDPEESNIADDNEVAMDGVIYGKNAAQDNENESIDEERQHIDFPSLQVENTNNSSNGEDYNSSQFTNSYSSAESHSVHPSGIIFSPPGGLGSSGARMAPHTIETTIRGYTPGGLNQPYLTSINTGRNTVVSQNRMSESSKPPSPGDMHPHQFFHESSSIDRLKLPNHTSRSQSHQLEIQKSNQTSLPEFSLVSPGKDLHGPKLPALIGLASNNQSYTLSDEVSSQAIHGNEQSSNIVTPPSAVYLSGAQNFMTHQNQDTDDVDKNNLFPGGEKGVWSYVRILEVRVKQLTDRMEEMVAKENSQQDKINRLSTEVISLKSHLNSFIKLSN